MVGDFQSVQHLGSRSQMSAREQSHHTCNWVHEVYHTVKIILRLILSGLSSHILLTNPLSSATSTSSPSIVNCSLHGRPFKPHQILSCTYAHLLVPGIWALECWMWGVSPWSAYTPHHTSGCPSDGVAGEIKRCCCVRR